VERVLLDFPHKALTMSDSRYEQLRATYIAFREGHGGRKPVRYYTGREKWTELPKEKGWER
jgi:hypothetical protein